MLALNILGIEVPDSRPLFIAALAVHVPAGMVAVVAGALAATARKQPGRHPVAGRVYLVALAALGASALVLALMRWRHDWPLFLLDLVALGAAGNGLVLRRRARAGWLPRHGSLMAASYVVLLTGFYIDNGPNLPVWDRLPTIAYWTLPALVGLPLTIRALARARQRAAAVPPAVT